MARIKEPLCLTCRGLFYTDAKVVKLATGANTRRHGFYWCSKASLVLEKFASECTAYDDKRNPAIDDLRQSAWILEKKTRIGIEPNFEFKKPEPKDS